MPSVSAYKKAFNIYKGLNLNDKKIKFILETIKIDHIVVKRYSEYEFPITLEFLGPNTITGTKILLELINMFHER